MKNAITPASLLRRMVNFAQRELGRKPSVHAVARTASFVDWSEPKVETLRKLELARTRESLTLRWALDPSDIERAEALTSSPAILCVRLVRFTKTRDGVLREVQDRPNVERAGQCEIPLSSARAIVALGLRAGDRFVSIAHEEAPRAL